MLRVPKKMDQFLHSFSVKLFEKTEKRQKEFQTGPFLRGKIRLREEERDDGLLLPWRRWRRKLMLLDLACH